MPSPLPATSSTRPSSRTGRRLRFAEVTPDDVHVYESAPRSPKQPVLALPPPPDTKDDSIVSLGTFNQNALSFQRSDDEPEEGTPEYIRRRYFPSMPANDPNLAWIEAPSQETTDVSVPRFDLHGAPISASLSASLPSHLGLHHHAEGSHAGYTLDDIFLLSRSTVPAQRASMLGVLAKIAHRLGLQVRHPEHIFAFAGQEGDLRKRILAAGLAAIDQIGSLGAQAVEVVWECLVEWDRPTDTLEGVELALAPDIVSSLQLDYFLPQLTDICSHAALPPESRAQLLAVVHWLAQQSNDVANRITNTPRLIPTILDTFLLTPIPPRQDVPPPNPLALQLLITLASASRANALALLHPADALLRFITLLPPSSPSSPDLASTLLTSTLRFYTTLASYGFYAHIATTASQVFTTLASYILSTSPECRQLRTAWAALVEAWTVCATDPHATSPPHEILWSQICAWGWPTDVRRLREGLGSERPDWAVYAAIWDAEAAWLQGARINGIKGGQAEREEALQMLRCTFSNDGTEFGIVRCALEAVQRDLAQASPTTIQDGTRVLASLASASTVLASALSLFLACLHDDTPPFALPLSELSALSATLVKHPVWSLPLTLGAAYLQVHLRPLTRFLAQFHRVSRYIPGTTPQLWLAQALVFLSRLLPGDEPHAFAMLDAFTLVTPPTVDVELPSPVHTSVLRPFFEYTVRPEEETYVAPLGPSTESLARATTHRLGRAHRDEAARLLTAGLPLTRDVLFVPLTHLLRSDVSPVAWTNNVDVVRATLLLVLAAHHAWVLHGLDTVAYDTSEIVFGCMRVCTLEHDLFRDAVVERLMARLLAHTRTHARTLEDASAPYLAPTPFYQFYTDLVAAYDATSFGHAIFAALVVAPLAMTYAVDYRRAMWCESDVAGRVRVAIGDVVGGDVRAYMYPVERDAAVLGAYVAALVRDGVRGLLRFVAVHHVACVVWGEGTEGRARLLEAVLVRGDVEVVREVVLYRQRTEGALVYPPMCYQDEDGDGWREERLAFVRRTMGERGVDRVRGVLTPTME